MPVPGQQSPYPENREGAGFDGPGQVGQDGEKGLGATLIGGASGGFLGHKAGGGMLGTVLGSVIGAIGANAVEHKVKKHEEHKHEQKYDKQLGLWATILWARSCGRWIVP
jgi:hypothetical protein